MERRDREDHERRKREERGEEVEVRKDGDGYEEEEER